MNAPSNQNSTVEDYTPVYVTATMHHLKMVMVKTLNHPQSLPHIRSPFGLVRSSHHRFSISPVKLIQVPAATFYLCTKKMLFWNRSQAGTIDNESERLQ